MYIALAGTDCQILIDTLEHLFGEAEEIEEPDLTELDPLLLRNNAWMPLKRKSRLLVENLAPLKLL